MIQSSSPLAPFLQKLEGHAGLNQAERDAILALPHSLRSLRAGAHLFREGERATHCCVILSGYIGRQRTLPDGARQILSVHMRGDGVDLQNALLSIVDCNVQALTRADVAVIPSGAVNELIAAYPGVTRALWIETLVDASIQREWTVNVGRRMARTRIAHLLCELGIRIEGAGIEKRDNSVLPLTQEHLADCAALTPVHVNRTLQALRSEGLLSREKRGIEINDWQMLADAGDFSTDYLYPAAAAA